MKIVFVFKTKIRSTFKKENKKILVKIISNYWWRFEGVLCELKKRDFPAFSQSFHVSFPDPLGLQSLSEKWNPACVQAIHLGDILNVWHTRERQAREDATALEGKENTRS